ncbi:SGNH/GDSL hydrolase family protein [Alkalihalobacillus sp. LMS39]|uniref:SGNH/GDSL hydrolase family protein n=1 Tax=Alkalihalobacillus sp. LMS39 TaxID=2924032 RepID=UPI001FB44394|nr:SGNH/GDSL hydrolase family protein [Alkalihalobacillus sp. LMS39]UOE94867.1 SGNH/GDSL hydrolase family protein [Alkalihalobacillus sp. LMS39]
MLQPKDKIVFIGDSITDCGRREDEEKMGDGYVRLIRDYYYARGKEYTIMNKGIGGDRVDDLASRWENDVISLQPDWVSISIGINDVWRQLDRLDIEQIYPDRFEQIFSDLLAKVQTKTKANLILMEPTIIEEDIHSEGNQLLVPYVKAIHLLAKKYGATVVPTHEAFLTFLKRKSDVALTTDGVHMTSVGNMLMAQTWLDTIEG